MASAMPASATDASRSPLLITLSSRLLASLVDVSASLRSALLPPLPLTARLLLLPTETITVKE